MAHKQSRYYCSIGLFRVRSSFELWLTDTFNDAVATPTFYFLAPPLAWPEPASTTILRSSPPKVIPVITVVLSLSVVVSMVLLAFRSACSTRPGAVAIGFVYLITDSSLV